MYTIVTWKKKPQVVLINLNGSVLFLIAGCYYDVFLLYRAVMERHTILFRETMLLEIKRKRIQKIHM